MAIALVLGCKGKGKDKPKIGAPEPAKAAATVPTVAVATVLAKDDGKPPFLFLVDDAGAVRLGAASSWADLDANKLKVAKKAGPLDPLDRFVREEFGLGRDPIDAIKAWDEYSETDIDLAALEDTKTAAGAQDDPPPPEEEDKPDDGHDETGGTGTAMALEEGKMGTRDSDRAEGQYKMKKNDEDPQLARQQAIEQARAAGILGSGARHGGAGDLPYAFKDHPPAPNEDGTPTRVAEVAGTVAVDGKLERLRAMVVISPTAKAKTLIDVVRDTDAAIAVSHAGKIRPLHLQFGMYGGDAESWVEARVSANGIVIEAVPDAPIEVAAVDAKQLATALDKARTARGMEADAPVDVLVDPEIDVQRLIDVVVALDTAGVRAIGLGSAPSAEELARRGHRMPRTTIGQPNAVGDLNKGLIRKVVKSSKAKIHACYATALATNPALAGTVQVQFVIKPDGSVATAEASGVDPAVSTCVASVIKALVFPKPNSGGGVQVNYPFTMRP